LEPNHAHDYLGSEDCSKMRLTILFTLLLISCSAQDVQKMDESSGRNPSATADTPEPNTVGKSAGLQSANSGRADDSNLPYLAVRKTSGPALQALMSGRLEVQGDCVVFVEPGANPKLAVFHPPASLKRSRGGGIVVVSDIFEITIGRDIRVGGGALPPAEDVNAALRARAPARCPDQAVEIGELVQ
jgi:hypothetical protein